VSPAELLAAVEAWVAEEVLPSVTAWDAANELPASAWQRLLGLGLPGALVPAEHGGAGLSVAELVPVWRALSAGWISLTGAVNPSGLATALLVRHGSPAQRERWLPPLAAGEAIAAFSITEPQAGSDLSRLATTARRHDREGLVLDGRKRWVAGGASADVIFLLALVEGAEKPSCVVLPPDGRGSDGWRVEELDKVGYRGVESAAYAFTGHHAAGAEVLGGWEDGLGRGTAQMLDALDVGRVNVACRGLGIADRAIAAATREATDREIGDGVLGDHTHAQLRLGDLLVRRAAATALTEQAARAVDAGAEDRSFLATAAKLTASELAVWAVDRAGRLAASRSYAAGDELARLRRDAPQTQIGEGANDALLLALGSDHLAQG